MGFRVTPPLLLLVTFGYLSQACYIVNPTPQIPENEPPPVNVTEIQYGPGYSMAVTTPNFSIVGNYLQLNRAVDYEVEKIIKVDLICRLNGGYVNSSSIYVEILNLNDNKPYFDPASYIIPVPESQAVNSPISRAIEAIDDDLDTLYYELSGSDVDATSHFRLTSNLNPTILVNKALDYDLYSKINLVLTARDPDFTATATIVIEITEVDDKPPFFLPCTKIGTKICINNGYTSVVNRSEQANKPLNLLPGPLYAVDGDYGINAPIEYQIVGGNNDAVFAVDLTSGNITMNKAVDSVRTILLQVMAYQTDDASKYSTTTVVIEVKDKNVFPPAFEKPTYHGIISALSPVATFVMDFTDQGRPLLLFAADEDFPDKKNPSITYVVQNSTDFTALRDGYILTNAVLTTPGTIVMEVAATDTLTSEKTVTLVTVDIVAAPTTVSTTTRTTTSTTTGTTAVTTKGTGTTTTLLPGTGTTVPTTKGTGTTTTTTPGTGTTVPTTKGTGPTTTTKPGTGTTIPTTKNTGTTTTTTPGTGTTVPTTKGTGTTTTPGTGTTIPTTKGTGTTTTTTPGTGTTIPTTKGTGTTTTTTTKPGTGTTMPTTKGTGTTTTTTPGTGSTVPTTKDTGTTTTTTPSTGTTIPTTKGTSTTTTPNSNSGIITTTTKSTVTTITRTTGTGTTTTRNAGAASTPAPAPGTGTTTITTKNTGAAMSTTSGTGTGTGSSVTIRTESSSTISPAEEPTKTSQGFGYTATDMAALGASLGAVLALCLAGLGFLIYKQYGNSIRRKLNKGSDDPGDKTDLVDNEDEPAGGDDNYDAVDVEPPSSNVSMITATTLMSSVRSSLDGNEPSGAEDEADESDESDDKKVKSILTKELKEDVGYKAVWFREDAAPEVVVIEGVEDGEVDDDYDDDDVEDDLNNEEGEDDDDEEDDDEEEDGDDDDGLDPTFSNSDTNNITIL